MLSFDRPSATAPGLFADHAESGRYHAIQDRLDLAVAADGAAELSLVLHSAGTDGAGGLFQARLVARRSEGAADLDWAPAEILSARLRVALRSPVAGAEELAVWRPVTLGGRGDLVVTFHMSPGSAEILRALALEGGNPVTLEVDLDHAGLVAGFPFVARADAKELHAALMTQLGPGDSTPEAIEAAFLSLPVGLLQFERTDVGLDPGAEALQRETAQRGLLHMFLRRESSDGPLHALGNPPDTETVAWRLDLPRVEVRRSRLRWEFASLMAVLTTEEARRRHFPMARAVQPFENVEIRALNEIPLDPEHALRVRLDLSFTGRGGTEETTTIEFRPGDPPLKSVSTVYPALTHPFRVASRLRLMVAPPGGQGFPTLWPATAAFQPAPNPLAIDVSPARADVDLVELRALDGVFACCGAVLCTIRSGDRRTIARLTAAKPHAWAVLPGRIAAALLSFRLEAEPPAPGNAAPVVIREAAVQDRRVLVSPIDVSVVEPDRVAVRLASEHIVFALVELRAAGSDHVRSQVLRPGETAEFAVWRSDIFQPLAFDWRVSAVRRDAGGRTLPIETSPWELGGQRELEIAA
ncbi:MAG: hypothetical protein ACREXW_11480 [Gammaproteobacteria bacterium]